MVDIQARLHPRALIRDAMTELRDAGIEIANGTVAAARRNPGPLIGIGATLVAIFARDWLIEAFAKDKSGATASPAPRSTGNDHDDGVEAPREGTPDD